MTASSAALPLLAQMLDGKGGASATDWQGVRAHVPGSGLLWLHMDYKDEETHRWIVDESNLDPAVVEALLATDTRPRSFAHNDGLLIILRAVNLNPGEQPDDMVSIRVWLEPHRIITVRHRRVAAIDDIRTALAEGKGPDSTGSFLVMLARRISMRMAESMDNLSDLIDEAEENILDEKFVALRRTISNVRRQIIGLRRYLAPQRDALMQLQTESVDWLPMHDRVLLRESTDRITRYIEDLDAVRDRAMLAHEELQARMELRMNKTMYLLSIVTTIFLPLGLLTGLLGINVSGIPGADNPHAFGIVCGILAAIAVVQLIVFRRIRFL